MRSLVFGHRGIYVLDNQDRIIYYDTLIANIKPYLCFSRVDGKACHLY
ncbi:hypothetical protein O9993_00560 [Vibrio lentus]|nr:hypothetical protein [Vibrio lentus]